MNQHIPTTAAPLPFTPKCLGAPCAVVIQVKPMTQAEFDRLGFELFRHNIAPVSTDTFRATMIDELFTLYDEATAERHASLLDQFWQVEDAYSLAFDEWRIAERDRVWDQARGAPPRDPAPMPAKMMQPRERARANLLAEEVRKQSRRMRDLTIETQTYEPRQRDGLARLVIEGWSGVKVPFVKTDGIVDESLFESLKAELGKEAIAELHVFIMSLGAVDEVERGNSDLLPGNEPDPTGSPIPSSGLVSSAGNSTDEPSGQTHVNASDGTIEQSWTSTTAASGASLNTDGSPMAEA